MSEHKQLLDKSIEERQAEVKAVVNEYETKIAESEERLKEQHHVAVSNFISLF